MKKIMLLCAVFCGVFSLAGAELPAKSWTANQMQGKFTFENKGAFPISLKCEEASAGKVVKTAGVWGRYMQRAVVELGKTYELKISYKMSGDRKAVFAVWVRDGANISRNFGAADTPRTVSLKFTVKDKKFVMIYLNLRHDIGEIEIQSVELNMVD